VRNAGLLSRLKVSRVKRVDACIEASLGKVGEETLVVFDLTLGHEEVHLLFVTITAELNNLVHL
jgi:hypothetical protein